MRFGSSTLQGVLSGSFLHHFEADLYYNGSRRLADVPITEPSFSEDGDAKIQQTGSVTVEWSDEFATSVLPTSVSDPFAPFGAVLHVFSVIEAGSFRERVEFGWYAITDVPSARDETMQFRGDWITLGSTVALELKELLALPDAETFDVPTAPSSLDSVWDEVAAIAGIPVSRDVTDAAIPRSTMYPENRLDAIYDLLGAVLDAVPHMSADGALSARPATWPGYVDTIAQEQIESVGAALSSQDVRNRVVVRATSGEDTTILAVAEITKGPLRARNSDGTPSPFRARTLYLSSQYVTTKTQAAPWAESTLEQVSAPRARVLPVVEKFNPLRERGDVVLLERDRVYLLCRVVTIERSDHATQSLTVEVAAEYVKTETVPPPIESSSGLVTATVLATV